MSTSEWIAAITDPESAASEPFMHRVNTLEHIAAEEGTLEPHLVHSPTGSGRHPGWEAPTAETIAQFVSTFMQDEAAVLRREYFARIAAAGALARDQVDQSVASLVSSTARAPLLPTAAPMPPFVARDAGSHGSLDPACAAV